MRSAAEPVGPADLVAKPSERHSSQAAGLAIRPSWQAGGLDDPVGTNEPTSAPGRRRPRLSHARPSQPRPEPSLDQHRSAGPVARSAAPDPAGLGRTQANRPALSRALPSTTGPPTPNRTTPNPAELARAQPGPPERDPQPGRAEPSRASRAGPNSGEPPRAQPGSPEHNRTTHAQPDRAERSRAGPRSAGLPRARPAPPTLNRTAPSPAGPPCAQPGPPEHNRTAHAQPNHAEPSWTASDSLGLGPPKTSPASSPLVKHGCAPPPQSKPRQSPG